MKVLSAGLLCSGLAAASRPVVYRDAVFGVQNESNVVYGQGLTCANKQLTGCEPMDLLLNVISPVDDENARSAALRPAYILVHGGSWSSGDKNANWARASSAYFGSRGFVTFSIDYRLDKDYGTYPTDWPNAKQFAHKEYPATRDIKAAVRFVRANAARFGVDPDRIALSGGSAGAISSIAAGNVDEDDYKLELLDTDPTLQSTNLDASSNVQCVVSHWGAGYSVDEVQLADSTNRSRYGKGAAPIIEFHGDQDTSVPYADALAVQAAYGKLSSEYELHTLSGCGHGSWCYGCDSHCWCKEVDSCDALDESTLPFVARHLDLDLVGPSPSPSPSPTPPPSPSPTPTPSPADCGQLQQVQRAKDAEYHKEKVANADACCDLCRADSKCKTWSFWIGNANWGPLCKLLDHVSQATSGKEGDVLGIFDSEALAV